MAELAQAEVPDLIAHFERPAWWLRWFFQVPDWPAPATADALAEAERRLDRSLPEDLHAFYLHHDGFPILQLGSVSELAPVVPPRDVATAEALLETPFALVDAEGGDGVDLRLLAEHLLDCHRLSPRVDPALAAHLPWPALLWCPRLESAGAAIVSTSTHRAYRDFAAYLRERAAEQAAWRD
jgi:hypothetical protein